MLLIKDHPKRGFGIEKWLKLEHSAMVTTDKMAHAQEGKSREEKDGIKTTIY